MRSITSRFVMLIATAAIAPLMIYGGVSIVQLGNGTEQTVAAGNRGIAQQAAAQIAQYIDNNHRVLRAISVELRTTGLAPWQQARILRDTVLDFPEFREISMFDAAGAALGSSQFGPPRVAIPPSGAARELPAFLAPLTLDNDGLPTTTLAIRFNASDTESGWVVGELALEQLWRMVDRIKVGQSGRAALFDATGRLIAHGDPDRKRLVAAADGAGAIERTAARLRLSPDSSEKYAEENGKQLLAVAATVPGLDWTVLVEQPTSEAFAVATNLTNQLLFVIAAALLATVAVGYFWGRSFLTRIFALTRATRALAAGRLDERVTIAGNDEIHQLGDAFNSMADSMVQLQDDIRKQERQASFGRIAAGLVHDLSHPIMSIGNSCKLIQRSFDDLAYRETFKRTVDRDLVAIKRVLDDLRNVARPMPLERRPLEIDPSLAEVVESMQQQSDPAGVSLRSAFAAPGYFIEGDLFALGRVYRNLILNAIQATARGGQVVVATMVSENQIQSSVTDTGCGIPPDRLGAIFEDYVTTKRQGLGLGLAISKKIVEQLGGRISVSSEVGRGTRFVVSFPSSAPRGSSDRELLT